MSDDPRIDAVAKALTDRLLRDIGHDTARAALAAADAAAWRPVFEAPIGKYHPYDPNGGAECAQFVLAFNGYHAGVAYCIEDIDTGDIIWTGEDGKFWPEPTRFQYITPPQETDT